MVSANRLDHTVINVGSNIDSAEVLFDNLGFTLTERGYHSTGSFNHLMMFGTDYLELLGVPEDGKHQRPDIAGAPLGINGLVFKTIDADATYAHLQSVGMDGDPPKAFSRPVDLDGDTKDAKFRTVTVRPDVFSAGRVYFCEHGTPELVWRPEWQSHANGTSSMPEFVTVSRSPAQEAEAFAKLLGGAVANNAVTFDGGALSVLSVDQYRERYGDLASSMGGRASIFGALVFKTDNRAQLADLATDGIRVQGMSGRTLVRVDAFDAVLEFVD
jgi:hypothetical protein